MPGNSVSWGAMLIGGVEENRRGDGEGDGNSWHLTAE